MKPKKTQRSALSTPWLVVLLVGAAIWVNAPAARRLVQSFIGTSTDEAAADDVAMEDEGFEDEYHPSPAGAGRPTFAPFTSPSVLPDPFHYPVTQAAPNTEAAELLVLNAPVEPEPGLDAGVELPRVSLILCTGSKRRAMVDGALVGIGDQVALGEVREIRPGKIVVRRQDGRRVSVPLGSIAEAERTQDPASAGKDLDAEIKREIAEELEALQKEGGPR
ncbi:MAG: hypothetical protein AAF628_17455 [Planctomycetota bacterium]